MKKRGLKFQDAVKFTLECGCQRFESKCPVCGEICYVLYDEDGIHMDFSDHPCPHLLGWNNAPDLSWLKMSFKQPPRPRRKKAAK